MHSVAADTAASPPEAAIAYKGPTSTNVVWIPPANGGADFYRVYGYSGGVRYLLEETSQTSADVSSSYGSYAVTTYSGGVESAARQTVCITLLPPDVQTPPCN